VNLTDAAIGKWCESTSGFANLAQKTPKDKELRFEPFLKWPSNWLSTLCGWKKSTEQVSSVTQCISRLHEGLTQTVNSDGRNSKLVGKVKLGVLTRGGLLGYTYD